MEQDLMTPEQVADMLLISTATVSRWAASGKLAAIRLSDRTIRFKRSDIERMLQPDSPVTPERVRQMEAGK